MITIQNLRKDFGKTRITKFRYVQVITSAKYPIKTKNVLLPLHEIRSNKLLGNVCPNGGETLVELTDAKGRNFIGRSVCSQKDNFNNKIGITKAVGNLVGAIQHWEAVTGEKI